MINFAAMSDEDLLTMYYEEEDEELADLAFTALDRRFRGRMLLSITVEGYNPKFVKLYNKPRLEHKADELVNEALLKVADSRGRPSARWDRSRQRVNPWIFGILRNVVISFLRKKRPDLLTDADVQSAGEDEGEAPSPVDTLTDETATPEEVLQQEALLQMLRECLADLPDHLRQVCELIYDQGLKQNEIATKLKLSAPTLTRRKQEATALLRDCLRRKGVGESVIG
jgi:RNA polymerase sigma factor (sigma-70 family)